MAGHFEHTEKIRTFVERKFGTWKVALVGAGGGGVSIGDFNAAGARVTRVWAR